MKMINTVSVIAISIVILAYVVFCCMPYSIGDKLSGLFVLVGAISFICLIRSDVIERK